MPYCITDAAANGDSKLVNQLLSEGCDVNAKGRDGMTALSISSFWGYTDIVTSLLKHGADVNAVNKGTHWTPLHCAAFQGHGPVVLSLLRSGGQTDSLDADGRTPSDFASAIDAIWPLFAAAGCTRTPKSELLRKKIIIKDTRGRISGPSTASRPSLHDTSSYLSRPGSAYVLATDHIHRINPNSSNFYAAMGGDVLANETPGNKIY